MARDPVLCEKALLVDMGGSFFLVLKCQAYFRAQGLGGARGTISVVFQGSVGRVRGGLGLVCFQPRAAEKRASGVPFVLAQKKNTRRVLRAGLRRDIGAEPRSV